MGLLSYPVSHPQVACRIIDGSAVIVLADAGEVNVLNQVGTRIWELIDGSRSGQQIAEAIEAEFEVSPEQARQDVAEFLNTLSEAGAVVLSI